VVARLDAGIGISSHRGTSAPDKEWNTRLEAFGDFDRSVRCNPSKRCSAIRDRYLTPKLLDGTDTIKMLATRQGLQIKRRRELTVHNRFALSTDEPHVISGTLDSGWAVNTGTLGESAHAAAATCGAPTHSDTHCEEATARNHDSSRL
jgi:hypothetical protein